MSENKLHNAEKTCWNCPAIDFKGNVDFRACGQSMKEFLKVSGAGDMQAMVECKRRPEIGMFDPASITFEDCPRFSAQAVAGIPLTVYGSGGQTRGFIALRDAMQCMTRLILSPPEPGQYDVVNQISGVYTIRDLAQTVAEIAADEFGLTVRIQRLENPRVEADEHPYEAIYEKLPKRFGFERQISLEEEIYQSIKLFMKPEIKARIEEKKHVIMPKTRWSGLKKEMDVIETYEVKPKRKAKVVSMAASS